MTPKQLIKKPIKQMIKIEHEKFDTEEGESNKNEEESTTSTKCQKKIQHLIYLLKLEKYQN